MGNPVPYDIFSTFTENVPKFDLANISCLSWITVSEKEAEEIRKRHQFHSKLADRGIIKCNNDLFEEQKQKLHQLIREFEDAFYWSSACFGMASLLKHHMDVGNSKPVNVKQFPIPVHFRPEIKKQLKKLCEQVIDPCRGSRWCLLRK